MTYLLTKSLISLHLGLPFEVMMRCLVVDANYETVLRVLLGKGAPITLQITIANKSMILGLASASDDVSINQVTY
jgi:hypothetical protein